jgi:TonB-dependent receptor
MTRKAWRNGVVSFLVFFGICTAAAAAQAPATGILQGRVVDATSGDPLPGATVLIEGTTMAATTDRSGTFRFAAAPLGDQHLTVTYLGKADAQLEVTVRAEPTTVPDVQLKNIAYEESVTVSAELIRDAQAKALNQQKTAPNITNVVSADQIGSFPDPNAAETTQRIPGISIQRDQGEGRFVIVRGTEPRLNAMLINGERIPSPDALIRQAALDVIPSDLLQSIEVSKALTPDMDADAIGGSVNLVMKQAPERLRLLGVVGGGYNELLNSKEQYNYSVTAGGRMNGGRIGAIFSVSGQETNRANQDMEVVYQPDLTLADFDPRFYRVDRRRTGLTGALDFRTGASTTSTIRGVFNRFIDDHENRQRLRERLGNRRIERELRDRTHIERVTSLTWESKTVLGQTELDYHVTGAYTDQRDPLTMTTTFRQSNVNFAPNVTASSIDPDNIQPNPLNANIDAFTFNSQLRAINFSKDRDAVAAVNLRTPLSSTGNTVSFLKFGAKFRDKRKGRDRNENTYTTSTTLRLTDFLDTSGYQPPAYLNGRYDLTPFLDQSKVENIPNLAPMTIARNHARDAEEFDGTERTTAAYAMAEFYVGPKLYLMPGLRYEYTSADFVGRDVQFAPNGAWLQTLPIESKSNYGIPLPAFHLKYAATPNTNFRAALTRTLARPNYYDTVPYRAQDDSASTVMLGNPDLNPTTSWNVDVLGEHYFKSVGVMSAGYFYKHLTDYIYVYTLDQSIGGSIYHVTQPLNGDAATVQGFELALQNQLTFLPRALSGIGVYANYTFSDSSASFPQHAGKSTLPGQSRHVGNLAGSYERWGFSGKLSVNFHGSYVDQVGATSLLDRHYDTHKQLDVSLSQKLQRNLRVFADFLNLNDALLRYYQGTTDRVLQEEHYRWWVTFGVKVGY